MDIAAKKDAKMKYLLFFTPLNRSRTERTIKKRLPFASNAALEKFTCHGDIESIIDASRGIFEFLSGINSFTRKYNATTVSTPKTAEGNLTPKGVIPNNFSEIAT